MPPYLERHLIPPDPALWKLDRFEDFITERKKLIKAKFAYLLSVPGGSAPVQPSEENGTALLQRTIEVAVSVRSDEFHPLPEAAELEVFG